MLPPGSTRVSGRARALLGVAGLGLATHRPLLCGGPICLLQAYSGLSPALPAGQGKCTPTVIA